MQKRYITEQIIMATTKNMSIICSHSNSSKVSTSVCNKSLFSKETNEAYESEMASVEQEVFELNQFCDFCSEKFATETELFTHLDTCYPSIKNIINVPRRQCLSCRRRMPQFSLCGLIRHAHFCQEEKKKDRCPVDNLLNSENIEMVNSSPSNSGSFQAEGQNIPKGYRHSKKQVAILKRFFSGIRYPTPEEIEKLSVETELTTFQIQRWFYYHRKSKVQQGLVNVDKGSDQPGPDGDDIQNSTVLKILEDHFQNQPNPSLNDLFDLRQETGIRIEDIQNWFTSKRHRTKDGKKKQTRTRKYRFLDSEEEDDDQKSNETENEDLCSSGATSMESNEVGIQLKEMSIRAKFATLKKMKIDDFKEQLSSCEPQILKLFAIFTETATEGQPMQMLHTLLLETELLSSVFKLNNPFSFPQISELKIHQSCWVRSILQLQDNAVWIEKINTWGPSVFQVWISTIIYSRVLQMELETGAQELYKLSLSRNKKSKVRNWFIPKLLEVPKQDLGI